MSERFGNYANPRHCLYVGWVVGHAMKHGIPAVPVLDDQGNYTPIIEVTLDEGVTIQVIVPEPPDGWTL